MTVTPCTPTWRPISEYTVLQELMKHGLVSSPHATTSVQARQNGIREHKAIDSTSFTDTIMMSFASGTTQLWTPESQAFNQFCSACASIRPLAKPLCNHISRKCPSGPSHTNHHVFRNTYRTSSSAFRTLQFTLIPINPWPNNSDHSFHNNNYSSSAFSHAIRALSIPARTPAPMIPPSRASRRKTLFPPSCGPALMTKRSMKRWHCSLKFG